MPLFSEHRLLHLKVEDLQKQRKDAGLSTLGPGYLGGTTKTTLPNIIKPGATPPTAGYDISRDPTARLTPEQLAAQNDPTGGPTMQTNADETKSIQTNTIQPNPSPEGEKALNAAPRATVNPTSTPTTFVKPPTKKQAEQAELDKIKITKTVQTGTDKNGNPIFGQIPDEVATQAAKDAKAKEFIERDKMAMQNQQKQETMQSQAGGTTTPTKAGATPTIPVKGPDFSMMDGQTAMIKSMIDADPTLAATYTPMLLDLMSKRTQLENNYTTSLNDFDSQDQNNDGVTDGVASQVSSAQAATERRTAAADRINMENRDINLAAANLAKEMATVAQKKFELEQHRNEQIQLENNIEMERKNRLIANKLGITTDGNGMRWMANEVRKGVEALTYLKEAGSLQEAEFALSTGKQYALNVRQATNAYDAQKMTIDTNFEEQMSNLNKIVTLDAKERRTERKKITEDYLKAIDDSDTKFAEQVKEFRTQLEQNIVERRTEASKKKDELWDRLFKQRTQDGNLNPALTAKIMEEMKAAGIDTQGLDPNTMTLEQQNEVYRRAKEAADKANAGRVPLGTQVQQLTDADKAFSLLDKAETAIADYMGVGGPVAGMTGIGDADPGWVAKIGKFGADVATGLGVPGVAENLEQQREATATFNLVKQVIGKALEGGVLRKEDELKYEKLLPTLRDSDRMRTYKLNQLRDMMNEGKRSLLDNMQRSGYNTSGYNADGSGKPYDPIETNSSGTLTNEEVDDIMNKIESGEPLSEDTSTGFLNTLAMAHVQHEGYGTPNAVSITKNNNPGALRWAAGQVNYGGVKPGAKRPDGSVNDTGFTWFPDVASGYRALTADLRAKLTGGSSHIDYSKNPTVLDYISVYAPAGDHNNPSAYAKAVVAQLQKAGYQVNSNTPLAELSPYIS